MIKLQATCPVSRPLADALIGYSAGGSAPTSTSGDAAALLRRLEVNGATDVDIACCWPVFVSQALQLWSVPRPRNSSVDSKFASCRCVSSTRSTGGAACVASMHWPAWPRGCGSVSVTDSPSPRWVPPRNWCHPNTRGTTFRSKGRYRLVTPLRHRGSLGRRLHAECCLTVGS